MQRTYGHRRIRNKEWDGGRTVLTSSAKSGDISPRICGAPQFIWCDVIDSSRGPQMMRHGAQHRVTDDDRKNALHMMSAVNVFCSRTLAMGLSRESASGADMDWGLSRAVANICARADICQLESNTLASSISLCTLSRISDVQGLGLSDLNCLPYTPNPFQGINTILTT